MYILAKKSGRGRAVELFGHTTEDDAAESWNAASPNTLVFDVGDSEGTYVTFEPLEPIVKPDARAQGK